MAIAYNTTRSNCVLVYRATGGGVTFSANLAGNTTFDYFTDTAVVNDAIYFAGAIYNSGASIFLNIGTPMAGTGIVLAWEYHNGTTWLPVYRLTDGSNNLTTTGAVEIKFPFQPNHRYTLVINGQTGYAWIRCRIAAKTTITEGGANSTTAARYGLGRLEIADYTNESPCTFTELYNWCVANEPDIEAQMIGGNTFNFPNCRLQFPTGVIIRSLNETVYSGNGCSCTNILLSGLWAGTLVGTNGWKDSSSFYFCYRSPSVILSMGGARVYGGYWAPYSSLVNGQTGLFAGFLGRNYGTWVGTTMEKDGYYNNGLLDRCTGDGNIIMASIATRFPTNLQIANPGTYIINNYGSDQNISGITYPLPENAFMRWTTHYWDEHPIVTLTNLNPILADQTGTYKTVRRAIGTLANLTHVWWYKASDETYTNYTTAAGNTTENDVPLSGDVGDYLLLYRKAAKQGQDKFTFTITDQSNDYEYIWEYYCNRNTWIQVPLLHDLTENFTKSGAVYCGINATNSGTNDGIHTISIAGPTTVLGTWFRVRIIKKGTGTPTFSRVQRQEQSGICSGFPLIEQYSYDLIVTDVNNVALQDVNVYIKDKDNTEIGTFATNSLGAITQQTLIRKKQYFDPNPIYDVDYNYRDYSLNPYVLSLRKYGYYFQDISKIVAGISADGAKIFTNPYVVATQEVAHAITGVVIDGVTKTITITEPHTMQEVYDYCEDWASLTANMGYNEPFVASGGGYYSSVYNLVINSSLTGEGQIDIGDNNLILNGTSTLDILAGNGDHINVSSTISGYGYIV